MIDANTAWVTSKDHKVSDTILFRLKVEEEILNACKNGIMWCLVPTCNYTIGAKLRVYRELVAANYSVTQRNNDHGNCLYIKWGHAHGSVQENK